MNDELLSQMNDLFATGPTLASTVKTPVQKEVAPAIDLAPQSLPKREETPGTKANTYSPKTGVVYQDTNKGTPYEATLRESSTNPYLGASLIPGQEVSARFRAEDGTEGNPFYLQATQRFIPVKPYSIHLDALKKDFMVESTDPLKIAYDIARNYQGVPEDRFLGYKYMPPELRESFGSVAAKALRGGWEDIKHVGKVIAGEALKAPYQVAKSAELTADLVQQGISKTGGESISPFDRDVGMKLVDLVNNPEKYDTLSVIDKKKHRQLAGTMLGVAATQDGFRVSGDEPDAVLWNLGEKIQSDSRKNKEEIEQRLQPISDGFWTQSLYKTGRIVPMAASIAAAGALTGGTGAAVAGGALMGAASLDNVRTDLLNKGYTYEEANRRGYLAGGMTAVANTAVLGVAGVAGSMAARAFATGPMSAAITAGAVDIATGAGVGIPLFTVTGRIEDYLADNIGAGDIIKTSLTTDEATTAMANGLLTIGMVPISVRHAYVNKRSQLKTLEERKEYDNQVSGDLKTVAEIGEKNRQALMKTAGLTEEQADIATMQMIQNGPEFAKQHIKDLYEGIAGRYSEDPKVATERVEKMLSVENVSRFTADQFAALDEKITAQLNKVEGITEAEKSLYRAVIRTQAGEWSVATGNNVSEYRIPDYSYDKLPKGMFGKTERVILSQDDPARITIDPNQTELARIHLVSEGKNGFERFEPVNEMTVGRVSTLGHELQHEAYGTKALWYTPEQWSEYYSKVIKTIQSAFGKLKDNFPESGQAKRNQIIGKRAKYANETNPNEMAATAINVLHGETKELFGISNSKAWDLISRVHSLLSSANAVVPMTEATQLFLNSFDSLVKNNSDSLLRLTKAKGADKLHTAIKNFVEGNENALNWEGITWKDIYDFAQAAEGPLNAEALQMVDGILGGINYDDYLKETERLFDAAWAEEEAATKAAGPRIPEDETAKTIGFADDIDPIEFIESAATELPVLDTKTTTNNSSAVRQLEMAAREAKAVKDSEEPLTPFQRQTEKKVGGRNLEQDMDLANGILKDTKKSRAGALFSERRGLEGFLFSLGGKKFAQDFDLAVKYQRYRDMFADKMTKFVDKFRKEYLPDKGIGAYQKFLLDYTSKTIDAKIRNPKNQFKEEMVKVSPDEIVNAFFQLEQTSNNGEARVKLTWGDTDIRSLYNSLTPEQKAFGEMMRDTLAKEAKSELQKLGAAGKIREKYFPFITWQAVQDDRPLRSFAFMSRTDSLSPVGIVGALEVFGRYQARLEGARSEYFSSVNRLKDMFDFEPAPDGSYTPAEQKKAQELVEKSAALKELAIERLGADNFNTMMKNIKNVQDGSIIHEVANGPMMKLAKHMTTKMLGGKLKQIGVGLSNFPLWWGAPDVKNTFGYYAEIIRSMAHAKEAKDNALRIGNGFFKHRIEQRSFTEFSKRGVFPTEDNLLADAAKFLKKKNLNNMADFAAAGLYLSTLAEKVGMTPTTLGDFLGNFVGADALQKTYYKQYLKEGLSPAEATRMADNDVVRFTLYRQSSSNQAMKPLMLKEWNRSNALLASLGQFTGEPIAKGGQIGQDIQGWRMGEMSTKDMAKDVSFILASQISYRALQAGLISLGAKAIFGKDISDEEQDLVLDNLAFGAVDDIISLATGPYNSIISPFAQTLFTNHNYGVSIPIVTEIGKAIDAATNSVKAIYTEEELNDSDIATMLGLGFAASGVLPAFENYYNTVKGFALSLSSDEQQAAKGRAMAVGRTEKYAEKKAGIKKPRTRKKSVEKNGVVR